MDSYIATTSWSSASLADNEQDSTTWAHGLGTNDIDWGFSVRGSSASGQLMVDTADSNGQHLAYLGIQWDGTQMNTPSTTASSGEITIKVQNLVGTNNIITVKMWARAR